MKKIDWTKPVRLVGSHESGRFVCRDETGDSAFPNIYAGEAGFLYRASDDGGTQLPRITLENVPPEPVVTFRNVYTIGSTGCSFDALLECLAVAKGIPAAICVLRIETVPGNGASDGVRTKVEVVHTY